MHASLALIIILLFISIVLVRNFSLKKQGIEPLEFGKKDKTDFIIVPFAAFYFYILIARAFNLPSVPEVLLFYSTTMGRTGIFICLFSLGFFIWTMISFKKSFRVGLVDNTAQGLITNGAFAISRNPIYVCFALMLTGQFVVYPHWLLLLYLFAGMATFHRQVLKEEKFLQQLYGSAFIDYCKQVRRYL